MGSKTKKSSLPFSALRWCFNTLIHQVILVIFVFIVWTVSYYTSGPIFWHALLCTIAYVPLMAEAILLYTEDTAWSINLTRRQKLWIHGLILGISVTFTFIGIIIEIVGRNESGKTHFGSPHSILGLISLILCGIGALGGLGVGNYALLQFISLNWWKILHVFLGLVGYILGIVSLYLAYEKKSIVNWTTIETQTAAKIATIFVLVYTIINPLVSLYTKVATLLK